ncbi:hypothetical protein ACHHYP_00831 [Achlya hypogyna]|uniref:FYVE zinc finger domain-containing protein n=1 Tax=Achlya hypogyna TaxID=1202772 RepID=A0A1V9ZAD6_ACHHY|nr:hypothetical protein ACHHYP_00831 [Achlya hypogyna]
MVRQSPSMYKARAGFLAVGSLVSVDEWVLDRDRSHCSVCVQQFYAFKRRHHCRTVVCSRCSKHRKLRLVELNVDLTERICAVCVTEATHATRDVSLAEPPMRLATLLDCMPLESPPEQSPVAEDNALLATWRLEVARQADTIHPDKDDTLKLLVHLVATSLRCPLVFLGLLHPDGIHVQASLGLDPTAPCIASLCAPVLHHNATLVVGDAVHHPLLAEKGVRYFAGTPIVVEGVALGAVVAMDVEARSSTSLSQRNTLESVARIAGEVLEQRSKELTSEGTDLLLDDDGDFNAQENGDEDEDAAPGTPMVRNEFQKAILVSPRRSTASNQTIELPSTAEPKAHDEAIESMMQLFRILHGCSWEPTTIVVGDKRVLFHTFHERYQHGYIKATRTLTTSGRFSWTSMLPLQQMHVYSNCLATYGGRQEITEHTHVHDVQFQPDCSWTRAKQYPVLTHWRHYPNGAVVYLGMQLREEGVPELCFGWMISSEEVSGDGQSHVVVSVIAPQHREVHEAAMMAGWLDRLEEVNHLADGPRDKRSQSCGASHDVVLSRVNRAHTYDSRPQTEAFFWTLLEQTMSTQRLLSEQQSDLMRTIETNGIRLHDLSEAVDRVESRIDRPWRKI